MLVVTSFQLVSLLRLTSWKLVTTLPQASLPLKEIIQCLPVIFAVDVEVDSSRIFRVRYTHPDPVIAAEIANLFMKEFIDYYLKHEIDEYMKMTEDLRLRIQRIDQQIEEKTKELNALLSDKDKNEDTVRIVAEEKEALIDFRKTLYTAFNESMTRVNMANPRARIIDEAFPPYADKPYKPNISKNLSYAFSLGLFFAALPHFFAVFRRVLKV